MSRKIIYVCEKKVCFLKNDIYICNVKISVGDFMRLF